MLALRRSSIDGDQKRIYVAQTCKDGKLDSAKTESSEASVKITDEDLANLASWRRTRSHAGPDDFIFENSTGTGPVCRRNVLKRTLRPAAKRVGIDYISWHLLRKWLGTKLKNRGVPITETQMRLRHADMKTTRIYYIQTEDEVERETARIASALVTLPPTERAFSPLETKRGPRVIQTRSTTEVLSNGAQMEPVPEGEKGSC